MSIITPEQMIMAALWVWQRRVGAAYRFAPRQKVLFTATPHHAPVKLNEVMGIVMSIITSDCIAVAQWRELLILITLIYDC